jgi:hypothetical protein
MAIMPGIQWRPLPKPSTTKMSAHDVVVIHTMVGSLEGTDGYFRRLTNGVNSHFGTGGDGTIRQWVDTAVRSGANGDGNYRCISIENADMGPQFPAWNTNDGAAVPPFTPQQIEANARICAWAHQAHGIPLELIPDSKPGRRGIGFHRLGVPGYAVPGGELWSSARGKVCPANRRIAQIPQIIARAKQIVAPVEELFTVGQYEDLRNLIVGYGNRTEDAQARLLPELLQHVHGYGKRVENAEADARTAAQGVQELREELAALRADLIEADADQQP